MADYATPSPDATPSPAETLRRAAALMRERADRAERGRWKLWGMTVMADPMGTSNVDDGIDVAYTKAPSATDRLLHTGNATHIASWHPIVALAVADWLTEVYCALTSGWVDGVTAVGPVGVSEERNALAVARAYLGEAS